jgi:hypothetical protein
VLIFDGSLVLLITTFGSMDELELCLYIGFILRLGSFLTYGSLNFESLFVFIQLLTINPCDKARGHASNNLNVTPGTAHGDRNRNRPSVFKTLIIDPETIAEIFTILTLIPAKNLVFRKKSATVPG